MNTPIFHTGFDIAAPIFDNTAIENPFYESSSKRDSFIEWMKNNQFIIEENEVKSDEQNQPSINL